MEKQILFLIFIIHALTLSAQLKLDLSEVDPPKIKYLQMGNVGPKGKEIRINNLYMEEAGVPLVPVMGEFHFSRMDARYWRDALLKMKASGVNIVSTYCLWMLHEEFEGELSWTDNLNLRRFVEICKELELKVHLRIGPYCNAEIRNGALPDWIVNNKNFNPRSNDPLYLEYVYRWYAALYDQIKGLLYKDGGPIMGIQLENEYVRKGMVISHLLNLKKIATKIGFDVPLYSMTHWMDSEYPKGEIVPYAGYYIETPWTTSGKKEIPTSDFEFFTYNRISNNIGTDIIKVEGDITSLSGENNDSPYFTCEVGVGSTSFYGRRAIIPEEMAGENINLRLGCGVNLMGYYMYVGGSNPVGKSTTFQSSGPRVNYDYQAPIREFGTLGNVMPETKKYNYFMNDFGAVLAPAVAYLPKSNEKIDNLQWAVRLNGKGGFIFCSNYLYKHERKDYKDVQFSVQLKNETIKMPRMKTTIHNGTYFLWPFNQYFGDVLLKYATAQPICSLKENSNETYFFFEDDQVPAEYQISDKNIKKVQVENGVFKKEKKSYFIHQLKPGKECVINITKNDDTILRFVTLTEMESDQIWKGEVNGQSFVALSPSSLIYDQNKIYLIDNQSTTEIWNYKNGKFSNQKFKGDKRNLKANFKKIPPMAKAKWIRPTEGNQLKRQFKIHRLSSVQSALLRYASSNPLTCTVNGENVISEMLGNYRRADITPLFRMDVNMVEFTLKQPKFGLIAEIEILMKNGERIIWNTDGTWTNMNGADPAQVIKEESVISHFAPEEHLAIYEIHAPKAVQKEEETRMYIEYKGDVANAYLNGKLVGDSFYDGSEWILSMSRLKDNIEVTPLIIRISGLKTADDPIYFEKNVDPFLCVQPTINDVLIKREYRFSVKK